MKNFLREIDLEDRLKIYAVLFFLTASVIEYMFSANLSFENQI